ncbi:MAG TPA: hypothetical protein DCE71_07910 [Parachlamydiales bacterium]|nr:hypothetical protein [Parachlamydiales bacterium]
MNNEILEAVRKTLPELQMKELQEALKKASDYDRVLNSYEECSRKRNELERENIEFKSTVERCKNESLKAQEVIREYEIKELRTQLNCAEAIAKEIKELAMAAFRNPTVVKSYNKQVPVPSGQFMQYATETETISKD